MTYLHTQDQIDAAKVGDACYIQFSSGNFERVAIAKISPTRRITIQRGQATWVFVPKAYAGKITLEDSRANPSRWHSKDSLALDVGWVEAAIALKARKSAAAAALDAVACPSPATRHTWSKESMVERLAILEGLLATARAAVDAI